MGSSSERTSTSYFSVSDGIRIYEEEISRGRLRSSVSEDSLLSKQSPVKQKKVTYAENQRTSFKPERNQDEALPKKAGTRVQSHEAFSNEDDFYTRDIPRLPSVKDLTAIFQSRHSSPEPKPKLMMKVRRGGFKSSFE